MPRGLVSRPAYVWWLFDRLRIFGNRDYAIAVVRDGDRLVHRSYVFPPYPRFPFMARGDLQIGDTWTEPESRGKGLARAAVLAAVEAFSRPGRTLWYVVEDANAASIRVIERAGFRLVGKGRRHSRLGVRLLGQYTIDEPVAPATAMNTN